MDIVLIVLLEEKIQQQKEAQQHQPRKALERGLLREQEQLNPVAMVLHVLKLKFVQKELFLIIMSNLNSL